MFYPSRHLANQALCRMFDKGEIGIDTWLCQPITETVHSGFLIVLPSDLKEYAKRAYDCDEETDKVLRRLNLTGQLKADFLFWVETFRGEANA